MIILLLALCSFLQSYQPVSYNARGITWIFSICSFKDPVLGSAGRKRELQESNLVSCVLHQAQCRHGFSLFLFLLLKAILINSFQYPHWGLCFFADTTVKNLFCRKMPPRHTNSLITLCILQQFCPWANFLMCALIFNESPNNLLGWLSNLHPRANCMRIPFGISILAAEARVTRFLPTADKRALFVGISP